MSCAADRIRSRIEQLERDKQTLRAYGERCMREEDWHGVEDFGSDMRDLEAELRGLRYGLEEKQ